MQENVVAYSCVSIFVTLLPLLAFELRRKRPSFFEPIVLANLGFFGSYFLKGILLEFDRDIFVTYPSQWVDPPSLFPYFVVSWIAALFLNLGYYANCGVLEDDYSPPSFKSGDGRFLFLAFLLISLLSCINIIFRIQFSFVSLFQNLAAWEQLRFDVMRTWTEGGIAFLFPIYSGFFHLGYEVQARGHASRTERVLVALVTLFVQLVIGGRAYFLSWILSLLIFRALWGKPISLVPQMIVLSLFPILGGVLGIIQKITTEGAKSLELEFPLNIFHRLSSSFEQFETLVDIMNARFKFDYGYSIFEDIFVTYLPRIIFTFKPLDWGFLRAQNVVFEDFWFNDRGTTYPVGILGELFFNFGYPGMFLGMALMGAILGWLRRMAFRDPNYIATFCMIGASLLAPQRFYAQVLMMLLLYLGATITNSLLLVGANRFFRRNELPVRG